MPEPSVFFDERTEAKRIQVVKVYDASYARGCFDAMDETALAFLARSLDLENQYEESDITPTWEDVEQEAREDGNVLSFFVVVQERDGQLKPLYVSPDWPSAEAFAKHSLG